MKKTIISIYYLLIVPYLFGQIEFTNIASNLGVNHSYLAAQSFGGVSCYDFNGDGYDDISLVTAQGENLLFYENYGDHLNTASFSINAEENVNHLIWVDFDNDNDPDLFVTTYDGLNRLYENDGELNFTDVTLSAGLPGDITRTYGACFGDFNRDGWLDLYFGVRVPMMNELNHSLLFKNNGDGTFTDITESSQTRDLSSLPFCSSFIDYNDDGWPDIYTANDREANLNTLLENNGNGTFTNVSAVANADLSMDAMCVAMGDVNQDGWQDIYISNTPGGNALLVNQGPDSSGQFTYENLAAETGVGFYNVSWGSVFLDGDNDGDQDLYVSGMVAGSDVISAAYYQNEGDLTFSEPMAGFIGDTVVSFSNAIGDFDNNGFPDILVNNRQPFQSQLWSNSGSDAHWLKVRLKGVLSNRDAIGSKIECYSNGVYQMRYTRCGNGFLGQNSSTEILGLGTASIVDSLIIHWPTGHIDRYYDLASLQTLLLLEGETTEGEIELAPGVDLLIVNTDSNSSNSNSQKINAFPNPTSDKIYIVFDGFEASNYAIFNMNGNMVSQSKTSRLQNFSIDIRPYPSGKYTLIFWNNKGERQWLSFVKV